VSPRICVLDERYDRADNAKLIASAPELLHALENLWQAYCDLQTLYVQAANRSGPPRAGFRPIEDEVRAILERLNPEYVRKLDEAMAREKNESTNQSPCC
jgi:hypothetical protein